MQGIGRKHTGRLIHWQKIVPSPDIRRVLHLGPEEKVYELEIIRSIDGIPLTVDTSNLSEKLTPGLEAHLKDFKSLTTILNDVYQIESIRVWELVEATLVSPEDAFLLNMPDDSPVLLTERLCSTAEGIPVEFAVGRMASGFGKIMLEFPNS